MIVNLHLMILSRMKNLFLLLFLQDLLFRSGGELPALLIVDAIIRLIPGVLNDSESALDDSFQDEESISAPFYTRPAEYKGMKVPEVLLSGNAKEIKKWKEEQSNKLTDKWRNYNNYRS